MDNFPIRKKYLDFRWTISKEKNTYGQTICSLHVGQIIGGVKKKKIDTTLITAGGYDIKRTKIELLAAYIKEEYKDRLKKLKLFYHGSHKPVSLCSPMTEHFYGLTLQWVGETKTSDFYTLTERTFNVRRQRQKRVTS